MLWCSETDERFQQVVEDHFELIREAFEKQPKQRLTEVWFGVQQTVVGGK